jgi:hypothetical protein
MTARFQPRAEKCDMCRATHTIGTFNYNKFSAVLFLFYSGKRRAKKMIVINVTVTAFSSNVD